MSARGFTLIELLVVIAIIGVLATVVLASLNTARRKSRDARRISDIKQLQLALELHFDGAGAGQYPPGVAVNNPCTNDSGLTALVTGGYIAAIPHDPNATGAAACYRYTSAPTVAGGSRTNYHLGAVLEDSANTALNSDTDCDDNLAGGAGSCGPVAGTGSNIIGVNSLDCIAGAAATDRCYDVKQ